MADLKISQLTGATTPLAGTEVLPIVQSSSTKKVAVSDLTAGRAVSASSLSLTGSPLPATSGGTGSSSSFVANGIGYASTTTTLTTNAALTWDGSQMLVKGNERIYFDTYTNATTHAGYFGRNTSTGNLEIASQTIGGGYPIDIIVSGTKSFTFDSANNIIVNTAAKGINFTANTGAAGKTSQLLNWYEEGTWTPTYYGAAGSAGSLAYAEQTGKYTRIGRLVTVTGTIILSNKGSWTGRVQIGGFPFTPTADQYTGQVELRNCTFTGNYVIMEIGRASTSFARFVIVSGLGANTQIDDTMTANNSGFLFTLTYMV